jgi:hypothetical protein
MVCVFTDIFFNGSLGFVFKIKIQMRKEGGGVCGGVRMFVRTNIKKSFI